jgi:AraC-like DNA-binding protein
MKFRSYPGSRGNFRRTTMGRSGRRLFTRESMVSTASRLCVSPDRNETRWCTRRFRDVAENGTGARTVGTKSGTSAKFGQFSSDPRRFHDSGLFALPESHSDPLQPWVQSAACQSKTRIFASPTDAGYGRKPDRKVPQGDLPLSHKLLRVGAAAFIPELLEEQGISTEAAFKRAGFSRQSQVRPVVPVWRLGLLFKSAAAMSARTEFGLMVGLRAGSRLFDGGKLPAQSETKVSSALMHIISEPAIFPNAFLTLTVAGDICTVGCVTLPSNLIARDQLTDCAIGFAAGALRVLCGSRWRALSIHFAHRPSPGTLGQAELLQAPITFDADVSAITLQSAWLDRDLADSRIPAFDNVSRKQHHQDLIGEVRTVLASWSGVGGPSASAVASALGLKPRALNRLLSSAGTSLTQMLEDRRFEMARRMLRDPAIPVVSIAWSLGYADASTFSRAFRRWSGMTTSEWRKAEGSEAS